MSNQARSLIRLLLVMLLCFHSSHGQSCLSPPTIDFTVQQSLCYQPYFFNILPKTEENVLLDNVCATFYPLPDDPNTFSYHVSYVYCDGSNYVESYVSTLTSKGTFQAGNPTNTDRYFVVGYAGCDTYVGYLCSVFGETKQPFVYGISTKCSPIGLSCLRKVEEVISNACLPEQEMYILPNKLPSRCVTQKACTAPPNPFYNRLGPSVGLL